MHSVYEHDTQDRQLYSIDRTYNVDLPVQTLTANFTQIQTQDNTLVDSELQQFNSFLQAYYTQGTARAPGLNHHP